MPELNEGPSPEQMNPEQPSSGAQLAEELKQITPEDPEASAETPAESEDQSPEATEQAGERTQLLAEAEELNGQLDQFFGGLEGNGMPAAREAENIIEKAKRVYDLAMRAGEYELTAAIAAAEGELTAYANTPNQDTKYQLQRMGGFHSLRTGIADLVYKSKQDQQS